VMLVMPLGLVGAALAVTLRGLENDIYFQGGLLTTMGLSAKNAILIVDFANHRKEKGDSTWTALIAAGKTRLRPILMTTLAMVIGMIPIATSTAAGSEWKNGLAWVLIGGLSTSLCLTVFVVPMVYYCVDRVGDLWRKRFPKKEETLANTAVSH